MTHKKSIYLLILVCSYLLNCSNNIPNYSYLLKDRSSICNLSLQVSNHLGVGEDPLEFQYGFTDYVYAREPISCNFSITNESIHFSPSISLCGIDAGIGFFIKDINVISLTGGMQLYTWDPLVSIQSSQRLNKKGNLFLTYSLNYAPFLSVGNWEMGMGPKYEEETQHFLFSNICFQGYASNMSFGINIDILNEANFDIAGGVKFDFNFYKFTLKEQ